MGLVLVLRHKPICIAESLWKQACKEVCDVKPGLDPCPLLARSWNRWWLGFVSFIAYKKVKIKFKKAKCVSNRCNDLFKRKKYFGFWCTLTNQNENWSPINIKMMIEDLTYMYLTNLWSDALPWEILCMKCAWNYSLSEKRQWWEPNISEQIFDLKHTEPNHSPKGSLKLNYMSLLVIILWS